MTAPDTAKQLRVVAKHLAKTLAERDRLVVLMRQEGATLRSIAVAAGITPPGVARILKRHLSDLKEPQ